MKIRIILVMLAAMSILTLSMAPRTAYADCKGVDVSVSPGGNTNCIGDTSSNNPSDNPIYVYLRYVIQFLGGLIGLAVVVSIIVSGIQYSASSGNPQNVAKAKERLVNSVIGLLLYIFLAAILRYLIPQVFS